MSQTALQNQHANTTFDALHDAYLMLQKGGRYVMQALYAAYVLLSVVVAVAMQIVMFPVMVGLNICVGFLLLTLPVLAVSLVIEFAGQFARWAGLI